MASEDNYWRKSAMRWEAEADELTRRIYRASLTGDWPALVAYVMPKIERELGFNPDMDEEQRAELLKAWDQRISLEQLRQRERDAGRNP